MSSIFTGRSSGVLLHPTSLPGPFGVGDLGPEAYRWVDFLARCRQTWWQILPLGPTGYGDSPYQCFSAVAGNPVLLSPEQLRDDGLLDQGDLDAAPRDYPEDRVDYGRAIPAKWGLIRKAWANFNAGRADEATRVDFQRFADDQAGWLEDYALFMALKDRHGGRGWAEWEPELLRREPAALEAARAESADESGLHRFAQFLFDRQWTRLRKYAAERDIFLLGDAPIFVSADSADVWANPELFLLDAGRRPTAVAGVPPDYFSPTGQLWGNPLYNWDRLHEEGYSWWVGRLRALLRQVDLVRLDHFRGFLAAWHVPAGDLTAENGTWIPGPGGDLFRALYEQLRHLPIVAEDLGEITPDVDELRAQLKLPGMRILHFAFGGAVEHRFLPHNYDRNTVVYTGTHDNDTTRGWYDKLQDHERWFLHRYLGKADAPDVVWDMIRMAWASVADLAVAPAQDLFSLGSECRMNFPGKPAGNWQWRLRPGQADEHTAARLADLTELYFRSREHQAGR